MGDSGAVVFDAKIDIEIFAGARDADGTFLVRRGLDGVDDNVLNGALNLDGVPRKRAGVIADVDAQFHSALGGHAGDAAEDLLQNTRDRDRFAGQSFGAAVALPHGEELTAKPHVLLNDLQLLDRSCILHGAAVFGLLKFLGEQLHIAPDDRERVPQVVNEFGRGLTQRREPLLLREFLEQPVVQLADLGSGALTCAMHPGALDISSDDVAHFASVERLADVVIGPETQRFLGRFERAKTRQHDDGKMWIDLADLAQPLDPIDAGHANVHDDGIGLFFLEQLEAGLDAIGGVHLVIGFQEHAQTFARTDLVVDDEDLGCFGSDDHNKPSRVAARRVPRAPGRTNNFRLIKTFGRATLKQK